MQEQCKSGRVVVVKKDVGVKDGGEIDKFISSGGPPLVVQSGDCSDVTVELIVVEVSKKKICREPKTLPKRPQRKNRKPGFSVEIG